MLDLGAAADCQSVAAVRQSGQSSTSSQRPRSSQRYVGSELTVNGSTGAGYDGVDIRGHEDTRHSDFFFQNRDRES
ncbi:hypothetical protein ABVT39_020288 [Epinephelus coioides]